MQVPYFGAARQRKNQFHFFVSQRMHTIVVRIIDEVSMKRTRNPSEKGIDLSTTNGNKSKWRSDYFHIHFDRMQTKSGERLQWNEGEKATNISCRRTSRTLIPIAMSEMMPAENCKWDAKRQKHTLAHIHGEKACSEEERMNETYVIYY